MTAAVPFYVDEVVTLHHGYCLDVLRTLPDASVDSVVTDPPYGLANTSSAMVAETITRWVGGDREFLPGGFGFMGKSWDAFVPPVAVWDECLRVLKPGGHVVAFAGSRTMDLMTLGVRLAGFEIRDSIAWLYSQGFPKSRDLSDELARFLAEGPQDLKPDERPIRPGVYEVTGFLKAARDRAGWSNRQIDDLFGTNGMAGHWVSQASQPAVPSVRQWEVLKGALGFGDEMDELVAELAATERPEDWGQGGGEEGFLTTLGAGGRTEPFGGWGTALKPAFEPIVVGRKPLAGTAGQNVLAYGTGALNIDGCRVPSSDADKAAHAAASAAWVATGERHGKLRPDGSTAKANEVYGTYGNEPSRPHEGGRWPTNVVLDEGQAAELDRQAPNVGASGKASGPSLTGKTGASAAYGARNGYDGEPAFYGDKGGASRFFPTFRYEGKAPTSERPKAGEVAHPTVKPLDLMRWLVRLVTPPGGLVLEPFAGSGTTAEACVLEGFRCVAIEREADYLPLIVQRLTKPLQPVLDLGGVL